MSEETPIPPSDQKQQQWLSIKEYSKKYDVSPFILYFRRKKGQLIMKTPGIPRVDGTPKRDSLFVLDASLEQHLALLNPSANPDDRNWITAKEYEQKYNVALRVITHLRIKGRMIAKGAGTYASGRSGARVEFLYLDIPLEEHPTLPQDIHGHAEPKKKGFPLKSLEKQRKKVLKEKYLQDFLRNAPDDRMVFSSVELQKLLNIPPSTISRDWLRWGLIPRPVPEEFKHLSGTSVRGAFVYTRRDLVRFFNGEWGPAEKGTPDDILLGATSKDPLLEGQYYKYDPAKVYPLSATGFYHWLRAVDIQIESKRLKKWVTYKPWAIQREAVNEALRVDENGNFDHRLVVFSAPRGEGKTLLACMVTLFFFFNGYSEVITLAGNSRDQSKFTHYDLCKSIIQHTPALFKTPGLKIQEKNIALNAGPKEVFNYMQPIPTSVGLLPNTTRAVFTELHNLQDTKFFYDLWTSLRNVPNAMVIVDTTVARPGHLVHKLWQTYQKGTDPLIYFHHYSDKHYNPEMTEEALNHFRETLPDILFNMYFRNRWEDAAGSLFPIDKIRQMRILEVDGKLAPCPESNLAIKTLMELEHQRTILSRGGADLLALNKEITAIENRIVMVDELYKIPASKEDLVRIGKKYGCDRFIIGVGLDRALRLSKHTGRTALSCVARMPLSAEESRYFILDIFVPTESTLPVLADKFMEWMVKYGWIDKVVVETYSSEDFYDWVADKALASEFVSPSYAKQKPVFFSMDSIVEAGHLKCPKVPYYTDDQGTLFRGFTNREDLFCTEMQKFGFVPGLTDNKGTFGSPDKGNKSGTQDDTIYSVGWAIYATHGEGLIASGGRAGNGVIKALVNKDVVGDYR